MASSFPNPENEQHLQPPSQQPSQQPENQSPNLQQSVITESVPVTQKTTVEPPNRPVIESERLVHISNIQVHFYLQYLCY